MAIRTDRIKTNLVTKMLLQGTDAVTVTSTSWSSAYNGGYLYLPTNKTWSYAILPINQLAVGDTITAFRVVGAIGGTTAKHTLLDVSLVKVTKGTGVTGSTLVQAMTETNVTADASLDVETVLTTPLVCADDYQYYFLIKGSTSNDATCDISLAGIELDVKKTFGQTS